MSHDRWEELGSRYRDGDLDAEERSLFEEHVEECGTCRGVLEADALFGEELKTMLDAQYPDDLELRTMARLRPAGAGSTAGIRGWASKAGTWLRHGEFTIPVPVAMAAAVALLVIGAFVLRVTGPGELTGGGQQVLVESAGDEGEWIALDAAEAEVRSLLRRTRTLLLALTTAGPDEEGRYHLEAEESLSRDLIKEVRLLESSDYLGDRRDILSLVRDLEVILLDVSTWQGEADADRLALLRGGIDDRSLIYRLATYESTVGGE